MVFSITLEQRKSEASYAILTRKLDYLKVLLGETAIIAKYTRDDVRRLTDFRDQQWVLRATLAAVDALKPALTSWPDQALTSAQKKQLVATFKETWLRQPRILPMAAPSENSAPPLASSIPIPVVPTAISAGEVVNREGLSIFSGFGPKQQSLLSRAFPKTVLQSSQEGMRLDWTISPIIRKQLQDDYPETRMEEQIQRDHKSGASMVIPDAHGATPSSLAVASQNASIKVKFSHYSKRELQFPQEPEVKWFLTKTKELQDVLTRDVYDHALMLKHEPGSLSTESNNVSPRVIEPVLGFIKKYETDPKYGRRRASTLVLQKNAYELTYKRMEKERAEDKAAIKAQETKIEALERDKETQETKIEAQATQLQTQAIDIKLIQQQLAQLLSLPASAPSPLAARAVEDDRREDEAPGSEEGGEDNAGRPIFPTRPRSQTSPLNMK